MDAGLRILVASPTVAAGVVNPPKSLRLVGSRPFASIRYRYRPACLLPLGRSRPSAPSSGADSAPPTGNDRGNDVTTAPSAVLSPSKRHRRERDARDQPEFLFARALESLERGALRNGCAQTASWQRVRRRYPGGTSNPPYVFAVVEGDSASRVWRSIGSARPAVRHGRWSTPFLLRVTGRTAATFALQLLHRAHRRVRGVSLRYQGSVRGAPNRSTSDAWRSPVFVKAISTGNRPA